MMWVPKQLSGLVRLGARAFFVAVPLLSLAACDLLVGDSLVTPAGSGAFQVLPLRAFLTRPSVHVDAMQFCRKDECGYDAAIGRVTVLGADAKALHDSLDDRAALKELLSKPQPNRVPTVGGGKPATPAHVAVEVEPLAIGAWKGVDIGLIGGPKHRQAFGVIVEKAVPGGSTFLIVAASSSEVAHRLATAASGD